MEGSGGQIGSRDGLAREYDYGICHLKDARIHRQPYATYSTYNGSSVVIIKNAML